MEASWTSQTSTEMILDNTDVRQKMTVGETAVFIQLKCSVSINLHRGFFFYLDETTNVWYWLYTLINKRKNVQSTLLKDTTSEMDTFKIHNGSWHLDITDTYLVGPWLSLLNKTDITLRRTLPVPVPGLAVLYRKNSMGKIISEKLVM